MTEAVLALDVGGTKARGALIAADGAVLHEDAVATSTRDPGLTRTASLAVRLLEHAGRRRIAVAAIGAGFPEYVDATGQLTSREVLEWTEQPASLLRRVCAGRPVAVQSDVRCGALGEAHFRGLGADDFVFVSLGTGLSSAIVQGGVVRAGVRGEAIAFGEFPVLTDDWAGNLETYASGTGIARRYERRVGTTASDGARDVVAAAASGDAVAAEILEGAGTALGAALSLIVAVVDPGAFVLGGGLGRAGGRLLDAASAELAKRTSRRPHPPPLQPSTAAIDPALLGAARAARELLEQTEGNAA